MENIEHNQVISKLFATPKGEAEKAERRVIPKSMKPHRTGPRELKKIASL